MTMLYVQGAKGPEVKAIRAALKAAMGVDAQAYPKLAQGQVIDLDADAAIRQWQAAMGLQADGVLGPHSLGLLGTRQDRELTLPLALERVKPLFPNTKPANLARFLPYVAAALRAYDLREPGMALAALATIRVHAEAFLPMSEQVNSVNTPPGTAAFSAYDGLFHNDDVGDGARYRGRGYVQLRGKAQYAKVGKALGLDLLGQPELANVPEVAATILAAHLAEQAKALQSALAHHDVDGARQLLGVADEGAARFRQVFELAEGHWKAPSTEPSTRLIKSKASKGASGRMVRGMVDEPVRKAKPTQAAQAAKSVPKRNARHDAIDLRDRIYTPPPISLMSHFPAVTDVRSLLPRYTKAGLVLDQGQEGACTGFGLASVINYLRWRQTDFPPKLDSVSPRMLYNLARRYDEYAGEGYEGSSCRGAIKGWFNHGVCLSTDWPYHPTEAVQPRYGYADRAVDHTLGVYYRIDTQLITDIQAAIQAVGAVYVSASTHEGWQAVPNRKRPPTGHDDLPVIAFDGRPGMAGGHAFALVGYNPTGFVLQNSWGAEWGSGGFAVLRYEDWLTNAMDAWVVSLGVPGVVAGRVADRGQAVAGRAGMSDTSLWWSPDKAYQHSVVLGNDGRVEKYLTPDEHTRSLAYQAGVLPTAYFREQPAKGPKRLVIYAHGGLNSESDAIERARAMGRYFLGNGCYPLFLVWKTGIKESIRDIMEDRKQGLPAGAGMLDRIADGWDLMVERSIGRPFVRPIWSEMKENAALAYQAMRGGDLLVHALVSLMDLWGDQLEIHLVGHSAGSITLGHLLSNLAASEPVKGKPALDWIKGVHLYAPACTVAFANQHYASKPVIMDRLHVSLLSDELELDDNTVGIYRKSLLYLVGNSLENDLRTPILGMERGFRGLEKGWDGSSATVAALANWREAATRHQLDTRLNVLTRAKITTFVEGDKRTQLAAGHGSFDNDVDVVTQTLHTIVGKPVLQPPVTDLRGF
jgi:predicted chitinase